MSGLFARSSNAAQQPRNRRSVTSACDVILSTGGPTIGGVTRAALPTSPLASPSVVHPLSREYGAASFRTARAPYRRTSTPSRPVYRTSFSTPTGQLDWTRGDSFTPLSRVTPVATSTPERREDDDTREEPTRTDCSRVEPSAKPSLTTTDSTISLVDSGHCGVSDNCDVFSLEYNSADTHSMIETPRVQLPSTYATMCYGRLDTRNTTASSTTDSDGHSSRSEDTRRSELTTALDWIAQEVQSIRSTERSLVRIFGDMRSTLHQINNRTQLHQQQSAPAPTFISRQRTTSACSYCGDSDRLQCWSPPPDVGEEFKFPLVVDSFRPRAISMLTAGEDRRVYIERQKAH